MQIGKEFKEYKEFEEFKEKESGDRIQERGGRVGETAYRLWGDQANGTLW